MDKKQRLTLVNAPQETAGRHFTPAADIQRSWDNAVDDYLNYCEEHWERKTWTFYTCRLTLLRRWAVATAIPNPYSALSSNRLLPQAGPWPFSFLE